MKRSLILTLLVCLSHLAFAQKNYEAGHYITKSGEKIEGLIKNENWRYNPDRILFKKSADDEPSELTPEMVQSIQIGDNAKFIGGTFDMDVSSDNLRKITTFQEAKLEPNPLFLKVLIEGKATLYEYSKEGLRRYFFSVNNGPAKQLIYKAYVSENLLQHNRQYKTQLWDNLKCESINLEQIQELDYFKKDMLEFFRNYNQCQNTEVTEYTPGKIKPEFGIWIRAGIQSSNIDLRQETNSGLRKFDSKSQTSFSFGGLLEYNLPFRNGKLSLVAEPTFQSTNLTANSMNSLAIAIGTMSSSIVATIDYSSITLPFGIKYYLLNQGKSQLSISGMLIIDLIGFNSSIMIENRSISEFPVNPQPGFSGELEYRYDNRFSLSVQYVLDRELLSNTTTTNNLTAKLSYVSVMIGYKLF